MRKTAFFAVLLAVATTANCAFAKDRVKTPTEDDMKWLAMGGVLSLFAGIPITILATKAAGDAADLRAGGKRKGKR